MFTPGAPGDFATQITVDAAVDVPPLDISGVMTALPDGCAVAPERSLADGWWLGVLALGLWRRRRQG